MFEPFSEARFLPHGAVPLYDLLLRMHHMVMENSWNPQLISSGAVSMQNNIAILQVSICEGFPVNSSDRTRSRRVLLRLPWIEECLERRMWGAPFDDAAPLLPDNRFLLVDVIQRGSCALPDVHFVRLNVHPWLVASEGN